MKNAYQIEAVNNLQHLDNGIRVGLGGALGRLFAGWLRQDCPQREMILHNMNLKAASDCKSLIVQSKSNAVK